MAEVAVAIHACPDVLCFVSHHTSCCLPACFLCAVVFLFKCLHPNDHCVRCSKLLCRPIIQISSQLAMPKGVLPKTGQNLLGILLMSSDFLGMNFGSIFVRCKFDCVVCAGSLGVPWRCQQPTTADRPFLVTADWSNNCTSKLPSLALHSTRQHGSVASTWPPEYHSAGRRHANGEQLHNCSFVESCTKCSAFFLVPESAVGMHLCWGHAYHGLFVHVEQWCILHVEQWCIMLWHTTVKCFIKQVLNMLEQAWQVLSKVDWNRH